MMNTNGFETNARVLYDVRVTDTEGNLVKLFSEEFTVTPSKITRSIQRYEERDLEQLKKHATEDENEYLTRAFSDIRMAANGAEKAIEGIVDRVSGLEEEKESSQKGKTKPKAETKSKSKTETKQETPKGNRGGRPRNRRWEILNRVFEKHGLRTKSSELFELANAEAEKEGIPPLNKHSFYSMLSIARGKAGIRMREKKEEKEDKQKH